MVSPVSSEAPGGATELVYPDTYYFPEPAGFEGLCYFVDLIGSLDTDHPETRTIGLIAEEDLPFERPDIAKESLIE
jgi:hypothetical protein